MVAHASVGVDDDLSAGKACIALGSADDKPAGGVDVDLGPVVPQFGGDHRVDDQFPHRLLDFRIVGGVMVLG